MDGNNAGYGDLTALNRDRLLLDSIGTEMLESIALSYLNLLGSSTAIYEKNGDYALGLFTSEYCAFLDSASRKLCGDVENSTAIDSGKWLCHESCWTHCSKIAIASEKPVDIVCHGDIRIYAIPIFAGGRVVGAINFGYGDPPTEPEKIAEIARKYEVDAEELLAVSCAYESRPDEIIRIAKHILDTSAKFIGSIIESKMHENEVRNLSRFPSENPNPVMRISSFGVIMYANSASAYLLQKWDTGVGGFAPDKICDIMEQAFIDNKTLRIDIGIGDRTFALSIAPVVENGYANLYGLDVTDRKIVENNLQRAKMEADFYIDLISHDLTNFNQNLIGNLMLLERKEQISQEGQRFLKTCKRQVTKAENLIAKVRAFSSIEKVKDNILQPVVINNMIKDVFDTIEVIYPKRNIELSFDPGREIRVMGSDLLEHVFMNVIENAVKYSRNNHVEIDISVDDAPATPRKFWEIRIADKGTGIPDDLKPEIFDRFSRIRNEKKGSGLGLSLVKAILENIGGKISVEDLEPGNHEEGSVFILTMPKA